MLIRLLLMPNLSVIAISMSPILVTKFSVGSEAAYELAYTVGILAEYYGMKTQKAKEQSYKYSATLLPRNTNTYIAHYL